MSEQVGRGKTPRGVKSGGKKVPADGRAGPAKFGQVRANAHNFSRQSHVFVEPSRDTKLIDLAPAAGASLVTLFFVGAQNRPTDLLWDAFAAFLGGLMAVEGTGELENIGYGMFGTAVAYGALRLTGNLTTKTL